MPIALDVNKEAVQVLVGAVGVREAARQMGLSENTVLTWANKGGWVQHIENAKERKVQSLALRRPDSVQSPTIKAADALKNVLEENYGKGRLGLSKWLAESAETLAKKKGDAALEFHQPAVSAASVLAKLCPPQAAVSMRISMFGSAAELEEPLTLEMEISEGDPLDGY